MGIGPAKRSSSRFDQSTWRYQTAPPNPNPNNYKIVKAFEKNGHLLIKINYPDCTTFEGNKLLVFKNTKAIDLLNQKVIDPHFSDNKSFISPVARFEPNEQGWNLAMKFMDIL